MKVAQAMKEISGRKQRGPMPAKLLGGLRIEHPLYGQSGNGRGRPQLIVRAVAPARDSAGTVTAWIASAGLGYCLEDDDCEAVARMMEKMLIRRLPVIGKKHELIGDLSLDDIRLPLAA